MIKLSAAKTIIRKTSPTRISSKWRQRKRRNTTWIWEVSLSISGPRKPRRQMLSDSSKLNSQKVVVEAAQSFESSSGANPINLNTRHQIMDPTEIQGVIQRMPNNFTDIKQKGHRMPKDLKSPGDVHALSHAKSRKTK